MPTYPAKHEQKHSDRMTDREIREAFSKSMLAVNKFMEPVWSLKPLPEGLRRAVDEGEWSPKPDREIFDEVGSLAKAIRRDYPNADIRGDENGFSIDGVRFDSNGERVDGR